MKMWRYDFAMTLVENQIFAIGGHGNANNSMETISIDGIEWENEALPNFSADDPCLVVHGKSIIITVRTWKYHYKFKMQISSNKICYDIIKQRNKH